MKLVSFETDAGSSWGVLGEDGIRDAGAAFQGRFATIRALLAANGAAELVKQVDALPVVSPDSVRLLPCIPDSGKIICVGLNYHEHREESHNPELAYPTLFVRWPDSQVGSGQPVIHPRETSMLDWEGEMAVVIGKGGRHIARADAGQHVFGYACYNDISVRDWQKHTTQFTAGKNFPTTGAFGPWLVTADEVPDVSKLHLQTRLNGEVVQDASVSQLIFDIPHLIEYISTFTALSPGDVIVTGTPGGVGFRRQPQLFMKPGDRIEVEITGLGVLANEIVADDRS